ncbi:MAG: cytochrome c [Myxococcales bacterium]|nr:cytochrome c [Myxococcales bacterium]
MTTPNSGTRLALLVALAAFIAPATATAGDPAAGKAQFDLYCFVCHGMTGKGDGPVAPTLNPPPRDFTVGEFVFDTDGDGKPGTDADLQNVITKGALAFGGSEMMAPWPVLTPEQVADLIAYVRSLKQ